MGKGDKKTKRGKILMGSYGVRRRQRKVKIALPAVAVKEEIPVKVPKGKIPAKPKVEIEEVQVELPVVKTPVEEVVKPARKKAPPKTSAKKTEKKGE